MTGAAVPAAAAAGASSASRRRDKTPAATVRAPTPSELAVHVRENVSSVFVIATVAIFAAILLNGLLLGRGGFFTGLPSATPERQPVGVRIVVRVGLAIRQREPFGEPIGVGRSIGIGVGEPVRGSERLGRAVGLAQPRSAVRPHRGYPAGMGVDDAAASDRRRMVEQQLRARGIQDERVLDAMGSIPRELFIDRIASGTAPTPTRRSRSRPVRRSASRGSSPG